jgi:acyl carrier protein
MAAGIDSLGATELQRALSEQLGTELEPTLLFDHPSAGGIVSMLVQSAAEAPAELA